MYTLFKRIDSKLAEAWLNTYTWFKPFALYGFIMTAISVAYVAYVAKPIADRTTNGLVEFLATGSVIVLFLSLFALPIAVAVTMTVTLPDVCARAVAPYSIAAGIILPTAYATTFLVIYSND